MVFGLDALTIYLSLSFLFIFLGYAVKNKVFTFTGGSVMLIISLLLLGFGYDVQTGQTVETNYTYVDNVTSSTNTTQTGVFTNIKDNYTYAIGTLLLILSLYMMYQIGVGKL